MPVVFNVRQILDSDPDTIIQACKGRLTNLYKRTFGEGAQGPWSFENGTLKDETGEIKVVFKDREPLDQNLKGKIIHILAHHGDKGWTGSKRKDDEYVPKDAPAGTKPKITPVLWVTKTGEVTVGESKSQETGSAAQQPASSSTAQPPKTDDKTSKSTNQKSTTGMRCKDVHYERKVYTGNFGSVVVGITLELQPGVSAQDALDNAKKFVEANCPREVIEKK